MANIQQINRNSPIYNVIEKSPSQQYKALIEIVEESGALENAFFDKCQQVGLNKEELRNYIINWHPITDSFAKYGLLYTHNVAMYISEKPYEEPEFKRLEKFFCEVLEISSGEFRLSKIDPKEFHARTFTRLAPKLGLKVRDIVNRTLEPINEATKALEGLIIANFQQQEEILSGFANYFVIETIAYNIVESMDNTFGHLENRYGEPFYDKNELRYISEHLKLEVEHCGEVKEMLKTLDLDSNEFELLKHKVKELAERFNDFWMSLL